MNMKINAISPYPSITYTKPAQNPLRFGFETEDYDYEYEAQMGKDSTNSRIIRLGLAGLIPLALAVVALTFSTCGAKKADNSLQSEPAKPASTP